MVEEVSGQQISAFALQIGDLPSHPSSSETGAGAKTFMLAPHVVATVAMEMLCDPMIYVVYLSVYLHVSVSAFHNFCI